MEGDHTDKDLRDLLQKDSEKAIEQLFHLYYPYLCKLIYRVLPDAHTAEDLAQEVFYELWRQRGGLQINTSVKAYLRRAAVNRTLNYFRDRKIIFDGEEGITASPDRSPGIIRHLEAAELQEIIDQAIGRLPERCRMVFVLSRFEDLSYKEIAVELGISVKTVENQMSKALKYLRTALASFREGS